MEKELILKIMKEALEINSRQKNTIFISYYGHTDAFGIQIHKKGWKRNEHPDYSRDIYMSIQDKNQNKKELVEILEYLNKIKELSITDQSHDSSKD